MERKSNIELLRCVLMWFVVIIHFVGHNIQAANNPAQMGDENYFSSNLLLAFSTCAVDCFVIISGYWGIKLTYNKLFSFCFPILLYEVIISTIYLFISGTCSIPSLNYWYVQQYLALLILSPLINVGLERISKEGLQKILLLSIVLFVLPISSPTYNAGKNVFIFILLYCIGYYLRHYYYTRRSGGGYFVIYFFSCLLVFAETMGLHIIGRNEGVNTLSYNYDNIFIVIAAISLFLFFTKIKLSSLLVNKIAKSAFYVYIIHENANVNKGQYGLYGILGVENWNGSSYYVFYIFIITITIFFSCVIVDKIRCLLFDKIEIVIKNKVERLYRHIQNRNVTI